MEIQKILSNCSSQQGTFLKLRHGQLMSGCPPYCLQTLTILKAKENHKLSSKLSRVRSKHLENNFLPCLDAPLQTSTREQLP